MSLVSSLLSRRRHTRNVYVDVGANVGETLANFGASHPDFELFAIEPNPALLPSIAHQAAKIQRLVTIIAAAAWVKDGTVPLFQSTRHESSTVIEGKTTHQDLGWPPIDYSRSTEVPCFDFSEWLSKNFRGTTLVVKMDIEGAEYLVLRKMLADGSLRLVDQLFCEWHADRLSTISNEEHISLRRQVAAITQLKKWS